MGRITPVRQSDMYPFMESYPTLAHSANCLQWVSIQSFLNSITPSANLQTKDKILQLLTDNLDKPSQESKSLNIIT